MADGKCSLDPNHCWSYYKSCPVHDHKNHMHLPMCTQGQPHYAHSSQQGTINWLLRCTTQTRSQIKVMLCPPNCKCKIPLWSRECFKIIVVGFLVPLLNTVWMMLEVGVSCGMANRDHCPADIPTSIVSAKLLARKFPLYKSRKYLEHIWVSPGDL